MSDLFTRRFHVRWGDMDFNGHMRNTAYLDLCGDVRMMYFQEHGFSMREFERLRLGPVITRDELEYFRELRLLENVDVTLALAGLSEDGSRFRLRNDVSRDDQKPIARITSTGGWLDLNTRRVVPPPEELVRALAGLRRTDDFQVIARPPDRRAASVEGTSPETDEV